MHQLQTVHVSVRLQQLKGSCGFHKQPKLGSCSLSCEFFSSAKVAVFLTTYYQKKK